MAETLTDAEMKCCHMNQWLGELCGQSLEEWRAEFYSMPASDHCPNCPALARGQEQEKK